MANCCEYTMRASGSPEALRELVADMRGDEGRERTMARTIVEHVEAIQGEQDADSQTWEISGTCAWSAYSCMTHDGRGTYGLSEDGTVKDWFVGIEDEADERGLTIEVHDCEEGMQFASRLVARPGEPLVNEVYDFDCICYEGGYDDLDELRAMHGLSDAEVRTLLSGEDVIRCDMDFDEWKAFQGPAQEKRRAVLL